MRAIFYFFARLENCNSQNQRLRHLLCGTETVPVAEHKVKVFEGGVLKRVIGSEREQVTGDWRELHSEELHDLCCSPNIIRVTTSQREMADDVVI